MSDFIDRLMERITTRIQSSLDTHFEEVQPEVVYESIEDYTAKTGQRFRMTKDEKAAGLSREEAFQQRFQSED